MTRDELIETLRGFSTGPSRELADGTLRLGHVPAVAPLAYLHSVYVPLSDAELVSLESELGAHVPAPYRQFLRSVSNGLRLFVSLISVFGLRRVMSRNPGASQPVSIVTPNTVERPELLWQDGLVIGSYSEDGSCITMRQGSEQVFWMTPDCSVVLRMWGSIDEFLEMECQRLHGLLASDYARARFDSGVNTLPQRGDASALN